MDALTTFQATMIAIPAIITDGCVSRKKERMTENREEKMENEKGIVTKEEQLPMDAAIAQIDSMKKFIISVMKPKVDYMELAGKSCLLKSGAEKLENLHGFSHQFATVEKVEDFEKGFFFYRYKCIVKNRSGRAVSESIGSANTKEKGRAGQDPYSLVNTIDKMAQKRAYVGAIIAACRVSSDFTQDLDDSPEVEQKHERKVVNASSSIKKEELKCNDCGAAITEAVRKYSTQYLGEPLCFDCQKKAKEAVSQKPATTEEVDVDVD